MANFSASQSFSTIGLCQKLRSTDNSNYGNNDEFVDNANVNFRIWTFRNASGTIIKQYQSVDNSEMYCECDISLLTLNINVDLTIVFVTLRPNATVQNTLTIPCLGI